ARAGHARAPADPAGLTLLDRDWTRLAARRTRNDEGTSARRRGHRQRTSGTCRTRRRNHRSPTARSRRKPRIALCLLYRSGRKRLVPARAQARLKQPPSRPRAVGGLTTGRGSGVAGLVVSGPGLVFCSDRSVYLEAGPFGVVCVFGGRMICGSVPGGSVPGGTSVELAGAVIGGVLPSWL